MRTVSKRTKKTIFYTTISIGMFLMFLSLYFAHRSLSDLTTSNRFATKSVAIFNKSSEFVLKNKEVQSNTREYLLGNQAAKYNADVAKVELPDLIDTLLYLVEDNKEQVLRVKGIAALSVQLLEFQEELQRVYETEGQSKATELLQTGKGALLFASLQELAEEIHRHEYIRLNCLENESGNLSRETIFYILGTSTTGVIGFCITILWLYYLFRNRKKHKFLRDELYRKERLQHQYLEAIPDGVIVINTDEEVKFVNQSGREMMGLSDTVVATLEQFVGVVPFVNPEVQKQLFSQRTLALTQGLKGVRSMGNRFDIVFNGEVRNLESNVQPIYDVDDTLIGAVCVVRDVTERESYAANLKAERDLVEQSVRVRDIFLSSVSHEIRTPLNTIIGFTDLLKQEAKDTVVREHIGYIEIASKSLLGLINDILDVSKMEFGQVVLDMEPTAISELVDSVSVLIRKKAADKGISYRQELSDQLPKTILTDKLRLTQILLNLCQNAIKFTEEGEVLLSVLPVGEEEDGRQLIRFVIQDTGIGIPEGRQEQVFDRFVQASEKISGKYGGTGLGLTIVKSLVEYFGGTIRLESKEKVGTTFTLEFPFTVIEISGEKARTETEEVSLPAGLSGLRILVAEDNLLNQKLLSAIFEKGGVNLVIVNNGQEVLDKLAEEDFDLIIMDVQMPGMDGYTAIGEIRNTLKLTTPIIMMTAHAMAGEREEGLRIGANSYLSKPFQRQELFSVIMNLTQKNGEQPVMDAAEGEDMENTVTGLVDFKYLREITGGRDSLRHDLVALFENDGIRQLDVVKDALANEDYAGLKQAIHKFRSSLFSVGLLSSAHKLKAIEKELAGHRVPEDLERVIKMVALEVLVGLKELKKL